MTDNKMKMATHIRYTLILGLLLAYSCADKNNYVQDKLPDFSYTSQITMQPLGDVVNMTFSSETDWYASTDASWLKITPDGGKAGTYNLSIKSDLNNEWNNRRAIISINGHTVEVLQDRPFLSIKFDDPESFISNPIMPKKGNEHGSAEIVFPWNQSTSAGRTGIGLVISSNIEWELELDEGFNDTNFFIDDKNAPDIYPYGATSGKTLQLYATNNNYTEKTENGLIKIRASTQEGIEWSAIDKAVGSYEFAVSQDNLVFMINGEYADTVIVSFDELGYLLGEDGRIVQDMAKSSKITVECETPWAIEENPFTDFTLKYINGQCGGSSDSGEVDETSIELLVDGFLNPNTKERQTSVNLSAADGEAIKTIIVRQEPYIFNIDDAEADLEFENGENTYHEITLSTSGSWEVDIDSEGKEWLEIEPTVTSGPDTPGTETEYNVQFKSKRQNLSLVKDDAGYIIFTAENGLKTAVPVSQLVYRLDAEYSGKDLLNLSATRILSKESYPVQIYSSGKWKLVDSDMHELSNNSWYNLSQFSGAFSQEIRVGSGTVNPSFEMDRTIDILLTSDIHEEMSFSEQAFYGYEPIPIRLRQRPFTFSVNGVTPGGSQTIEIAGYKKEYAEYLDIQSDGEWEIHDCPEWITPSMLTSTMNETIFLDPKLNISKEPREQTFTITCLTPTGNSQPVSIIVKQSPISFDVTAEQSASSMQNLDPLLNYIYNGTTLNPLEFGFSVEATEGLPWKITSNNGGFISGQGNFTGSKHISVKPETNTLTQNREGKIAFVLDCSADPRISEDEADALRIPFTFSQKAYEFDSTQEKDVEMKAISGLSPSKQYSVKSSGPWTLSSPDWVWLEDSSGQRVVSGASSLSGLSLHASPNMTTSERNGTIRIISDVLKSNNEKQIRVKQNKYYYELLSSTSLSFEVDPDTAQNLIFRSSGDWRLEGAEGWTDRTSGKGNDDGGTITILVKPAYNTSLETRNGTITIISEYGSERLASYKVNLFQDKYSFSINKTSLTFTSPFAKETSGQTILVSCSDEWDVKTDDEWIKLTKNSYPRGDGSFIVSIQSDNLTTNSRTGNIKVTSSHAGVELSESFNISVSQSPYELSIETPPAIDKSGGTVSAKVKCSGNWVVTKESDPDSIVSSFSPASGNGNGVINFTVNKNRSKKERSATFKVKCEGSDALSATIRITQRK